MKLETLTALNAERAARRAVVLVTNTQSGEQRLVKQVDLEADPMADILDKAIRSGKSGTVEHDGKPYFLTVQTPPVRLVVIGAVHISQAMAPIARTLGLDMTIIDPRTAFATPERFPDVALIVDWPQEALPDMKLDRYTAMACFTHDPKIDDPALVEALNADCFYIGALGSRKTHGRRVERLTDAGFSEAQIGRIKAPIGLDIGSVTPAEIAVAVLGEVILALRKKPLRAEAPEPVAAGAG